MTRIFVTGCGVFVPGGKSLQEFWQTLINGKSQIGPITAFDPSGFPTRIAAEISGYDPREYFEPKEARRTDRYTQFSILAAREAVDDARLRTSDSFSNRNVSVYEATSLGPTGWLFDQHTIFLEKGYKRLNPLAPIIGFPGAASARIAGIYNQNGRVSAITGGSVASILALDAALSSLRLGQAEIALVVGAEAPIFPAIVASFSTLNVTSRNNSNPSLACRPFDALRDGIVLGEGAGALVIETEASARLRGASLYAEIRSIGVTCDHYHLAASDPSGTEISRAMELALREARIESNEIDYLNAHGTATKLNDLIESKAIRRTFGPHAERLPVTSIKGTVGHLLGACGVVELVASILSIRHQKIPPTANFATADDSIRLQIVAPSSIDCAIRHIISNNYSFGGKNTAVVISAVDNDRSQSQ